jgi:hypothetical protein
MPATKKSTAKKKAVARKTADKKVVVKKKAVAKKATVKKKKSLPKKKVAANSRQELMKKLREDLKAGKAALSQAKSAAKAEFDVINEKLKASLKREQALLKLGEQKAKMMLAAGQRWEKEQVAKIKKLVGKKPSKAKK